MSQIYSSKDKSDSKKSKPKKSLKTPSRDPKDYSEIIRKTPPTTNPMAAFMVRPKGVSFETQDDQEKILLMLRRHPITNLPWALLATASLFVPLVAGAFGFFSAFPFKFEVLTSLLWYLVTFGYAFERFLDWYFNVYIVTDERIIDYDFYSLIYKRVSEAKIDRIEDVTFSLGGITRSIFHYGDVFIQTAGESRELDFEAVPYPEKVVKLLNELQIEEELEKLEGRVR